MDEAVTTQQISGRAVAWAVARGLAALLLLLCAVLLHWIGQLLALLFQSFLLLAVLAPVARGWGAWRKQLAPFWLRRPWLGEHRGYLLQFLNRSLYWSLAAWVLLLAFPEVLLAPTERPGMPGLILGAAGLLILCEAFPLKQVYRLPNALFALGWLFLASQLFRVLSPVPEARAVVLQPPFRGSGTSSTAAAAPC